MAKRNIRIAADVRPWLELIDAMQFPNDVTVAALAEAGAEIYRYLDGRVPVDTGALRASGKLSTGVEERDDFAATMQWGGVAPDFHGGHEIVYAPQAFYHARTFEGVESTYDNFQDAMFAGLRAHVGR